MSVTIKRCSLRLYLHLVFVAGLMSCLRYLCYLLCFSSSCVPYVASFSELSIFDWPSVFSNVYSIPTIKMWRSYICLYVLLVKWEHFSEEENDYVKSYEKTQIKVTLSTVTVCDNVFELLHTCRNKPYHPIFWKLITVAISHWITFLLFWNGTISSQKDNIFNYFIFQNDKFYYSIILK